MLTSEYILKEINAFCKIHNHYAMFAGSYKGELYPGGIYFYKLLTSELNDVKKMILS